MIGNLFFGGNGGLLKSSLTKLTNRTPFSRHLPYGTYSSEEQLYINTDETIGFMWECKPLVYASDQTFKILEGLFSAGMPEGSVLQFMLYADPDIDYILEKHRSMKTRKSSIIEKSTESLIKMFKDGTTGIKNFQGIPVRNFRLIVSLKISVNADLTRKTLIDIRDIVSEVLKGAQLGPRPLDPEVFLNLMLKLLNGNPPQWGTLDKNKPIKNQCILPETKIETSWKGIKVGEKFFRCMTPKKLPVEIDSLTANYLTGDIWGFKSDTTQITNPFIFTVNCIFENLKSSLHTKCNFVLQQKAAGSLAPSFIRKQEEYLWATGEIERGTPFVRIMPMFWHISPDESSAGETAARVKRMWEAKGFSAQEDRGILNILLISALPFGLYNTQKNVEFIERDFIVHSPVAVKFLPIQADFSGVSNPIDLYIGRKGQIATLDIFDESAINHNCMISANSGSGKSFLMNYLLFNYYSTSGIIRIIDIGGSYKKLCKIVGGKYISFTKDSGIILNPFSNIVDINEDQNVLAAIICQMIYSSTSEKATETQMTLIKQAVRHTYSTYGNQGQLDHVYDYLHSFEKHCGENLNDPECTPDQNIKSAGRLAEIALDLAFNMQDFTSTGVYGKWFCGESNLNIAKDDFVVLELEDLKPQVELFRVVILQLINYITNNLYLSTRTKKRIIVFDESWQFLGQEGTGSTEASMMEQVIEGGYRRARKYNGAFITIFQSLLDLKKFGGVGNVIKANSAFKFLLESTDYAIANHEKIIDYNPFLLEILKSVKTPKPRYSEIFMETPVGTGVARLLVTPYNYWMFTSDAKDNARIEALVKTGMSYADAFELLSSEKK